MYTYSLNLEFVMLTMMMIAMVVNGDDTDDEDEGGGCAKAVMTWVGRSVRALETLARPICSNQRWDPHCGDPPQSASTWKVTQRHTCISLPGITWKTQYQYPVVEKITLNM